MFKGCGFSRPKPGFCGSFSGLRWPAGLPAWRLSGAGIFVSLYLSIFLYFYIFGASSGLLLTVPCQGRACAPVGLGLEHLMQNKLQQGLRGGLISLNPWRPSGAGESQTLWCASGSPRESLSFLQSPSLLRSFRRSWLAMRSRVRSLRSPLRALDRASHRASLALRGWLRGE